MLSLFLVFSVGILDIYFDITSLPLLSSVTSTLAFNIPTLVHLSSTLLPDILFIITSSLYLPSAISFIVGFFSILLKPGLG